MLHQGERASSIGRPALPLVAALASLLSMLGGKPLAAATITVVGACNLIAAIDAANTDLAAGGCPAGSGADTIELLADVELTLVHNSTDGFNGLPSIVSDIEINGPFVKIERKSGSPSFRLFHVGDSGRLTLRGIEVTGGEAVAGGGASFAFGGGIYNRGVLALIGSAVSENEALGAGSTAVGGGIYSTGPVSLDASTIDSNLAQGSSGTGGGLSVTVTAIEQQSLPFGLRISDSTLSNNIAQAMSTSAQGGAIRVASIPRTSISGSTIFNNFAIATSGRAFGGGVASLVNIDLENTTISTNRATSKPGVDSRGGGAYLEEFFAGFHDSEVGSVRGVTFRGNVVSPRPPSVAAALLASSRVTVTASIFSGSLGPHCAGTAGGMFVDGGDNLADAATCAPTIAATLSGVDPALLDNGGPTDTHALLAASTAIDIAGACGLGADQRGAGRIPPCDAGAFETIGCDLLELDNDFVSAPEDHTACNTAMLGPALVVTSNGVLGVTAGLLVTLRNDFFVFAGGELILGNDPGLLP